MKVWLIALLGLASATVYFSEEFDQGWETRWVQSKWKSDGSQGKFVRSAGKWHADPEKDAGIQTSENYRFYAISSKFQPFSNKDKPLVLQFTVKHEQNLDCGGGYIKLLPSEFDQSIFGGDTPYLIMFGPDICGGERKTHLILSYKGKNYLSNRRFRVDSDTLTHQYTTLIYPNNTYQILIDNNDISHGNIEDHWDILPPKEIKDPSAVKPADWVDEPMIVDPEDKKPEGWDDIPEFILDPKATKPEDWNDEEDGAWEAPKVPNPEYKGEWRAKRIPNPNYKGPWVQPTVPNSDYVADPNLYLMENIGGVGIEIWQVTAGSIFDNIFVGDDPEEARQFSEKTFAYRQEKEKALKEAYDKETEKQREEAMSRFSEEEEESFEDFEDYGIEHEEL
jgi:calreticulin